MPSFASFAFCINITHSHTDGGKRNVNGEGEERVKERTENQSEVEGRAVRLEKETDFLVRSEDALLRLVGC